MATIPQIDVEVRVEYLAVDASGVIRPYVDKFGGGVLGECCFPGLSGYEIEALPNAMYLSGLNGNLSINEIRLWKQEYERRRQYDSDEWRKAKLAATPEPDAFDRLFEPRTA